MRTRQRPGRALAVLAFERSLLLDNVRNEITVEQRSRMFIELERVESAMAERRQQATQLNGSSPVTGISCNRETKALFDEMPLESPSADEPIEEPTSEDSGPVVQRDGESILDSNRRGM